MQSHFNINICCFRIQKTYFYTKTMYQIVYSTFCRNTMSGRSGEQFCFIVVVDVMKSEKGSCDVNAICIRLLVVISIYSLSIDNKRVLCTRCLAMSLNGKYCIFPCRKTKRGYPLRYEIFGASYLQTARQCICDLSLSHSWQ